MDVRWNCYSQIRYIKRNARKCNCVYIVGLVQDPKNFIVNALELLQTCTKPSICVWFWFEVKRLSSRRWSTQQGDWVLHVPVATVCPRHGHSCTQNYASPFMSAVVAFRWSENSIHDPENGDIPALYTPQQQISFQTKGTSFKCPTMA